MSYQQLLAHTRETAILGSVLNVLEWDERTYMPPGGGEYRAEQSAYLAGLIHQRRTAPQVGEWLAELADGPLAADPQSDSGCVIRQLQKQYAKKQKLPQSLVEELDAHRQHRTTCVGSGAQGGRLQGVRAASCEDDRTQAG